MLFTGKNDVSFGFEPFKDADGNECYGICMSSQDNPETLDVFGQFFDEDCAKEFFVRMMSAIGFLPTDKTVEENIAYLDEKGKPGDTQTLEKVSDI